MVLITWPWAVLMASGDFFQTPWPHLAQSRNVPGNVLWDRRHSKHPGGDWLVAWRGMIPKWPKNSATVWPAKEKISGLIFQLSGLLIVVLWFTQMAAVNQKRVHFCIESWNPTKIRGFISKEDLDNHRSTKIMWGARQFYHYLARSLLRSMFEPWSWSRRGEVWDSGRDSVTGLSTSESNLFSDVPSSTARHDALKLWIFHDFPAKEPDIGHPLYSLFIPNSVPERPGATRIRSIPRSKSTASGSWIEFMSLAEGQGWLWLVLPQWMVMGIPWFLFVFHGAKCSSQSRQKKTATICRIVQTSAKTWTHFPANIIPAKLPKSIQRRSWTLPMMPGSATWLHARDVTKDDDFHILGTSLIPKVPGLWIVINSITDLFPLSFFCP